uniref:Uncharacterized protein n=1 Tax=Eutreptiella gymnastica TaxID=73025 RepID=A0A7S4FWV2_9EUGL
MSEFPKQYKVISGEVSIRKGPNEKSAEVASVQAGWAFITSAAKGESWEKSEFGGLDGWVDVEKCKSVVELMADGAVECILCGCSVPWSEWAAHKKQKSHQKKFDYNGHDRSAVPSLADANRIMEQAALRADPTMLEALKPKVVVPAAGFGRWDGAPPPAKKAEQSAERRDKAEDEELTEEQKEWRLKANSQRDAFSKTIKQYNVAALSVAMPLMPGACPPFAAGRGKAMPPPNAATA